MLRGYNYDNCIICDSKTEYFSQAQFKCPECGHMTEVGVPDVDKITSNEFMGKFFRTEKAQQEVDKMVARWRMIEKHAPEATSILDYGCGPSYFLPNKPDDIDHYTKIKAFDVNWRYEYSDERVLDEYYDVLCAWHVLEHFTDPWRLLDRVRHKYLFLISPWIEFVTEKELPSWPHFEHGMHFQFFTQKSMDIFLSQYDVLEQNYMDGEMSKNPDPRWIVTFCCKRKT